ncbi:MAG TPA: hypothetical protein PK594_16810, partial [Mycobacterium sp.]|nr:hypothetical protein [Mycobacterium sp.]
MLSMVSLDRDKSGLPHARRAGFCDLFCAGCDSYSNFFAASAEQIGQGDSRAATSAALSSGPTVSHGPAQP